VSISVPYLLKYSRKILDYGRKTDKKESQIFLIYKEIQNGAVAKSYMRKGFLIHILYEEMRKYLTIYRMRRRLVINDFATAPF
jgi:hypothetical protein